MLAFDSNHKLLVVVLVNSQYFKEVAERLSLVIRVCRDGPGMCVHRNVFCLKSIDELIWEMLEQFVLLWIFDDKAALTWFSIDLDDGKSIFMIIIRQEVNELKSLADTEDREVDTLFVFLTLHVAPDTLGGVIERSILALPVHRFPSRATSEENAIDWVEQGFKILIR